jgi:trimeric autotransporter adhesin
MTQTVTTVRRGLLLSACFPLAALIAATPAHADQVVVVAASTPVATVNADIATKIGTPDRNIAIQVTAPGIVTGPGTLLLNASAGQGDGTVGFSNAGAIGAVDADGLVADSVAVVLAGDLNTKDNSLAATNGGLITGGFRAFDFGSTVELTNSGTIYNGIQGTAARDVSLLTTGSGKVASGSVSGTSLASRTSKVDGDVTTSVTTSGNVKIVQADVGTKAARGNVTGLSRDTTDVTVTGIAGTVTATGAQTVTEVTQAALPPAAGKTVTTSDSSTTLSGGTALVTLAAGSDVISATAQGLSGATISVGGAVSGAVAASTSGANSSDKSTVTQDADGNTVETTSVTTFTNVGGAASVTTEARSTVGGNLQAQSNAGAATVTVGGKGVSATASSTGTNSTFAGKDTFNGVGVTLTSVTRDVTLASGGKASGTVAAGGALSNSLSVSGDAGATATVAGMVAGGTTATSTAATTTTDVSLTRVLDSKGVEVSTAETSRTVVAATGGLSGITIADRGGVASASAEGDAGSSVINSGTVTGAVTATSNRSIRSLSESSKFDSDVLTETSRTIVSKSGFKNANTQVGAIASVANNATGLIGSPTGGVTVDGIAGATVVNNGDVRGTTNVTSGGINTTSEGSTSTTAVTAFGKAPALDVTTTTEVSSTRDSSTAVGGNVTGTYAGANGTLNFSPAASGSVTQTANGASTATVSGAIFGNLSSAAGQQLSTSSATDETRTTVLDTAGTGTVSFDRTATETSDRGAGGSSKIVVTGTVGAGNVGGGTVTSTGSGSSSVAINGGTVEGSVTSTSSGILASSTKAANSYAQTVTKGVAATGSLSESSSTTSTVTAGASSAELTGTGRVNGSLSVNGLSGATVSTGADSKVGGNVSASVLTTTDGSSSTTKTYSRDSKTGLVASLSSTENKSGPSAAGGNATATVAGTVAGGVSATARAKDASVVVTGSAVGGVVVATGAATTTESNKTSYAGVLPASANTSFDSLGIPTPGSAIPAGGKLEVSTSSTTTWSGGKASVLIDTAAALQTKGVVGAGSASANGLGGATVDVTAGSRVNGAVIATSSRTNSSMAATTTYLPQNVASSTSTTTNSSVGGVAAISNKGEVLGSLIATGVGGATVTNSGKSGSVSATAFGTDSTVTTVDTNFKNAAQQVQTTTTATRSIGSTATVTNAAGATIGGGVSLAGKAGTLTNAGFITGTTTLGQSRQDGTEVLTKTDASTKYAFTPSTTRLVQTYTVEQSGISRGYNVTGATSSYLNPQTGATDIVRTSDVTATLNLNSGSVTLGSIEGQVDTKTGERLTATTVNLKGSGWLGADVLAATPPATNPRNPSLTLSKAATDAGFGTAAVRVSGVNLLQKQDAGSFVIHGQRFVPSTTAGVPPVYTLDVGQFTINGGEVQLSHDGSKTGSQVDSFGIRGNVTNNATLVLGRRVPNTQQTFGNSIVGIGPETIEGIRVTQVGNFTQSATGTIVAAVTPSLVRFGSVSLVPGGAAGEPLGAVTGGVSIPYFTSAANAGSVITPSRVNITGNLALAGNVQAVVTRDSLFRDGDGYTLFTYTGTGAVTATVTPTIASPFVSFTLVNDAAARSVRLTARRSSFTAAALNSNASAAAASLDTAVADVTARIQNDATGGSGFGTVAELSNAQDLANMVSALDWRLSRSQAAELFDELGSASIYGSLAAIDQNVVFGQTAAQLGNQLSAGQPLKTRLWLNPVGDFARYAGSSATGASRIRSTAYGLAFGADVAFSDTGAVGFGGSYGEHDVTASNSPSSARVRTWTIGAYASQGFGDAYVSGLLAYGFSRFNVDRSMELLSRSMSSSFRGTQFDASLEGGYNFQVGTNVVATPFAELAVRSWKMNSASEVGSGGGGVAVLVEEDSQSVFSPTIGGRIGGKFTTGQDFVLMPHARLSYTFQGDIGSDRLVRMVGGGNSFSLRGVDPGGFGTIEAGLDTVLQGRFNLFVRGGYSFAGGTDISNVRGGISFDF